MMLVEDVVGAEKETVLVLELDQQAAAIATQDFHNDVQGLNSPSPADKARK